MIKCLLICAFAYLMASCTLSFQNIDTHGSATDLVDENQATSPTISPTVTVPVSAIPSAPTIPGITK